MLKSIKQFFDNLSPAPQQTEQEKKHALQLAVCVLLVEMTRSDGKVCESESLHLSQLIDRQFDLSIAEKLELTELASKELELATDFYQFTSVINLHFSASQKITIIEQLWEMAHIDGDVDAHERHYLDKINALLHVPRSEYIKTKLRVEAKFNAEG